MDQLAAPLTLDTTRADEVDALLQSREQLRADISRLEQELDLSREAIRRTRRQSRQGLLRHAETLGALHDRTSQADCRVQDLTAELEAARSGLFSPNGSRWWGELERLRLKLEQMRSLHRTTAKLLLQLRRDHAAALAGLSRPGPVQYIASASAEGYQAIVGSGLMDPRWYLARYKDVAATGDDPVAHYLEHGWREGRQPGPMFDGVAYLAANPDVAASGVNPLVHFVTAGAYELRSTAGAEAALDLPTKRRLGSIRIIADLRTYDDYKAFARERPDAFDAATESAIRTSAIMLGTSTEFLGSVGPEHTRVAAGDLREALVSGGLSSRTRALADLLIEELRRSGATAKTARIYGHEAVTPLAALMRERFPRFLGTEYAPSDEAKRRLLPFVHNDVCASQFPDESFDLTVSCDVLEHVYDRDALLREAARTTVAGGVLLATFPFAFDQEVGALFAEIVEGDLKHHLDVPIYHGNPVDEDGGALVFEIPGWDIVERARRAGFKDAVMRFVCDEEKGVTASGEGRTDGPRGVFVLLAYK